MTDDGRQWGFGGWGSIPVVVPRLAWRWHGPGDARARLPGPTPTCW
jgi:hypothetical protein